MTPAHTITVQIAGPSIGRYHCTCGWTGILSGDGAPYDVQNRAQQERHDHEQQHQTAGDAPPPTQHE